MSYDTRDLSPRFADEVANLHQQVKFLADELYTKGFKPETAAKIKLPFIATTQQGLVLDCVVLITVSARPHVFKESQSQEAHP
ncbi:MAG: hypothetical protein IVW51_17605 [Thermaceae bacterium]|nr:hypothetical protein [Thermaceae bacterium]